MLRRPPSFAAGSLLTILATPHSKSFQPAVVSTWLRRRRSVATRARCARAETLAGRPAKEVEPRIAKRRAAAGIALARMPAAACMLTRTGETSARNARPCEGACVRWRPATIATLSHHPHSWTSAKSR